jgi:hypothetical protein
MAMSFTSAYVNAALGFGAAVFALRLTLSYNAFAPVLGPSSTEDEHPE